jgi:hypothetical protein
MFPWQDLWHSMRFSLQTSTGGTSFGAARTVEPPTAMESATIATANTDLIMALHSCCLGRALARNTAN